MRKPVFGVSDLVRHKPLYYYMEFVKEYFIGNKEIHLEDHLNISGIQLHISEIM